MHLPKILPTLKGKPQVVKLAQVCLSAERVSELIGYLTHAKLGPKAAWVLSHVLDQNPALGQKHELELLEILETTPHSAVARSILKYFTDANMEGNKREAAFEIAMAYLEDRNQPVAPKVFAMEVAWRFGTPEQKSQLIELVQNQMPQASAGFKSRGNKILKYYQVVNKK